MTDAYTALIRSDRVSTKTREALLDRATPDDPDYTPRTLTPASLATLRAILNRVLPQNRIDLAQRIDNALSAGETDGWRFAALPADAQAFHQSLVALAGFEAKSPDAQDAQLAALAAGDHGAPLKLWFEDLRGRATMIYVSHPSTFARMGYSGIAYAGDGPKDGSRPTRLHRHRPRRTRTLGAPRPMNLTGMKRFPTSDIVDAVIVGTGAGGAPLLAKLAQAGLRVVALEAGRNWNPADFPADEITAAKIYWRDERLSAGATPEAFGGNNSGTGVGGSMLHWGAFCPRPDPRDLKLRTTTGAGVDWPIEHAELIPYIEQVEAFIGVSGPTPYPWDPARAYAHAPVTLNAPAYAMQLGCAAIGVRTAPCPAAVLTHDVAGAGGDRQRCINCGHCHQGCRNGAKTSMDVTYLPAAVAAGAEIRPDCFVHGIERDTAGRVTAIVYRDADGIDQKQRCAALFLCAGAVETPRLMLHTGIGSASGQVGRNYLAHVATQVWGTFAQEMRCNKGYPSSLITEDMIRPADADFAGGYLVQSLGVLPVTWANQVARSRPLWGQPLIDYIDATIMSPASASTATASPPTTIT